MEGEMGSRLLVFLVAVGVLLSSYACTLARFSRVGPGELKLVKIQVPEVMQENLPYEVVLTYKAEGEPRIERVCCRWVTEEIAVPSTSLYWYSHESASNQSIGSARTRWNTEGNYTAISSDFCVDAEGIRFEASNKALVRLKTSNFKPSYNKIECYAEYLLNGQTEETNRVGTRFSPEL